MKKTILFSNQPARQMTFEEVREQFAPMVIRAMKNANNRFIYNAVEEEDFRQELEIELWRAFKDYDPNEGNCFTTYLHYKLQKGVRNATYSRYSLKNQHNGILSMSAPVGEDDLKLEDLFSTDDTSLDNISFNELTAIIRSVVTEEDEDTLKALLNKKEFPVQVFADKYGITRQAANQRIVKLRTKLRVVISKEYLEIV
ncbi:sigma-70 family RNA polymerase sigma factor [Bacillus wiedmannii]|uniref:sigma-70 family RNA polymerase sigma factor n=1 Tax=Bacillus wiedmannii TaxID=1890302 RepID=UPI001483C9C1|nr:sigma-70 family RNA polymerase sigma factor [Bacillus wiedmannii]